MSINGFNSGFRDTVNGTAITQLSVLITPELASSTIWFFDYNTCAQGGVGGININENTNETLQGCAVSGLFKSLIFLLYSPRRVATDSSRLFSSGLSILTCEYRETD